MAWSGSAGSQVFARLTGLFTGSTSWQQTNQAGRGIDPEDHDTHDQDLANGINACLKNDGGNKATANIDFGGFKIVTLGDPSSAQDAATKNYVDTTAVGFTNFTVRGASTANVNLTTDVDAGSTFDGLTLVEADRILLKNQTSAAENGIYLVPAAAGTATRPTDMDAWSETIGAIVNVTAGTAGANTSWRSTSATGGTINVTSLSFVSFGTSLTTPITLANGGTGSTSAADAFSAIKQPASATATGVVEHATVAEFRTGTDTTRVPPVNVPWDALAEVTLTDAATIAVDMATFINGVVTLGGNRTLGNPTNPKAGQSGRIRIVQDGSGSRTLAYASNWEFINGTAPTLSTTAADNDVLYYDVISSTRILAWLARDIS